MKRISAGYYEGEYKGVCFEIIKVDQINVATKNQWFWKIGSKGGEDWFSKKSIAVEAVKESINENINYYKSTNH